MAQRKKLQKQESSSSSLGPVVPAACRSSSSSYFGRQGGGYVLLAAHERCFCLHQAWRVLSSGEADASPTASPETKAKTKGKPFFSLGRGGRGEGETAPEEDGNNRRDGWLIDWRKELPKHAPAGVITAVEAALQRQKMKKERGKQEPQEAAKKEEEDKQKGNNGGNDASLALYRVAREGFAAFTASLASFE